MKFQILHTTHYQYASEIVDSINEIRLSPLTDAHQSCLSNRIMTLPQAPLYSYEDYFHNLVYHFSVVEPHTSLTIRSMSTVVTGDVTPVPQSVLSYEEECRRLNSDAFFDDFAEYLNPSEYTPVTGEIKNMANQFEQAHVAASLAEKMLLLTAQIHHDYTYDPSATQVQTKIVEMIQHKRGVCQDFAHLMITLCRAMGIPARYVSGYQYITDINGANADFEQASHAWVEVYLPGAGWIGYDPTNNVPINWRYIIVARGRDYRDIVPVKGIYHGTPEQQLNVSVDVQKIG
ncbi:MAG: transglutaminase family protein [Sporolactobacillus sp.]